MINEAVKTGSKISAGIEGLDDIMGGGFPAGHLYLIEGDPGTGKTTLALQFLLEGVARGEKSLYVTLSESKQELLDVAKSHAWSLDGIEIFELLPEEENLRPDGQYTVFHPSEVELADTTKSVIDEVKRLEPSRVIIDSLSELRMLARDPLRYRRQIMAFKQFFYSCACTVLLIDDRSSGDHDLQLESIAHGVLSLENLAREYGIKRRRVEVIKLRASVFREGYHDYSIKRGGLVVYPRLVAAEHRTDVTLEPVPSGVPELDQLWGGGVDQGTSTLIMGPAGAGKSTIAAQYAVTAAQRGESAAIYLFDEVMATYVTRLHKLGINAQREIDTGRLKISQVDPAELSPGEFVSKVRHSVEQDHAKIIIIDSLNGLMNAMPGESFMAMHLHELLTFLNQSSVASFLVLAQHGLLGMGMASPVDVSYLADSVLLLRYFESEGEIKQAISVFKKRSGGHERTIRELRLDHGIKVGPPLHNLKGVLTGVPEIIQRQVKP